MFDTGDIEKYLDKTLSKSRIEHTYSVCKQANDMCSLLGRDDLIEKAQISALLHDITKELPLEEHIKLIKRSDLKLNEEDLLSPSILHSFTGAITAKELFPNIVDGEIFGAIFNHTTGKEDMAFLEKVIFLADYIEPTRRHSECKELRKYFYDRITFPDILDASCLKCLSNTINYLTQKGEHINSRTLLARNYLLKKER